MSQRRRGAWSADLRIVLCDKVGDTEKHGGDVGWAHETMDEAIFGAKCSYVSMPSLGKSLSFSDPWVPTCKSGHVTTVVLRSRADVWEHRAPGTLWGTLVIMRKRRML